MINEIGNHVRAGKNRRTALMSILEVTHPDFLEFLHVKLDRKELTNFNISVGVTKRFIAAVQSA
jgi:ribonucleoside-diphosphate reductase alpha chain